jgi:hypothetical protein
MIKNRCSKCLKKKLFTEKCKCDNNYCLDCLPYFNHNCNYDWMKNNKDKLIKSNPKIEAIKVDSI